jgi:SAM-dependent methyltransferase
MNERSAFAGGDQGYLRDVQYVDSTKFSSRAQLHIRYGTATVRWFPWFAQLIDWPEGARVLDAGCGPGLLWEDVAGLVPATLALTLTDLSPGMVAEAERRARDAGHDVVEARPADNAALPFADAAFDIVVANHTIHHAPDPDRAVAELTRVLDPGGVLLATANGPDNMREINDVRGAVFGEGTRDETADVFGRLSAPPILARHLATVTWHAYSDELVCTDLADVLAYATSTPPGEDATPAQLDDLRARFETAFAAGDGRFRVTKDAGAFIGRKTLTPDR